MPRKAPHLTLICTLFFHLICPTNQAALSKTNFERGVVVSQNKIASAIGADILSKGGNAIDAAIATGYALGVVEPNGSGIGGGGFALIYLAKTHQLKAIDFRERAPLKINESAYEFGEGAKAGGVPGTIAGFEYLRRKYGTQDRETIFKPIIELADQGFKVNETLHKRILARAEDLREFPSSRKIFLPNEQVPEIGDTLVQKDLAESFRSVSKKGADEFYRGKLSRKIIEGLGKNGGIMTAEDLASYEVFEWKPLCGSYRGEYKVCSFPLPSSGGTCLIEALNILENFDLPNLAYDSPERIHYLVEALKFSFADRATKLGDPRFNQINFQQLLSKNYSRLIAARIMAADGATKSEDIFAVNMPNKEKPETTHLTVVDKEGNIAAITISLNGMLGSAFVIPETGILLNNTLDDFSKANSQPNQFGLVGNTLNAPEPKKTPLSSMSPTIVFDLKKDEPILALGSPGGPTIISAVLNTLLAYLDQRMSIEEAVAAGRAHHQYKPDFIYAEKSLVNEETQKILIDRYQHRFPDLISKDSLFWSDFYWTVEAVEIKKSENKLTGAADPRKEQGLAYEKILTKSGK